MTGPKGAPEGDLAFGWTVSLGAMGLAVTFPVQAGLAWWASRARRAPALVWWCAPLGVWCLVGLGAIADARGAVPALSLTPAEELLEAGVAAAAAAWRAQAVGLLITALALLVSTWLAAIGHVVGAGRKPRLTLAPTLPPLGAGLVATPILIVMSRDISPLLGALVAADLLLASLALSVSSVRRSAVRTDDARIVAARGLVASLGGAAVLSLGLAVGCVARARIIGRMWEAPLDERPALAVEAVGASGSGLWLGLVAAGAIAAGATAVTITAPRAIGTWRTVLGALTCAVPVLVVLLLGTRVHLIALAPIHAIPSGGALAEEPVALTAQISRPRDLSGDLVAAGPLVGTCLVREGALGWEAGPLFEVLDQRAHIARHERPDTPMSDIERLPGCPEARGPLTDPFSMYEHPVLAVPADRLAVSVAGARWFLRHGTLSILTTPDLPDDATDTARAWQYRTVPFRWEMPPADEQVGDGDDQWDYEGALRLPVTLLEGSRTVLVAGGSRTPLPEGDAGAVMLRDALLAAERRDLVLVPRKSWQIQTLVNFCLTVVDRVEGATCVLRPENPSRWSERTGLPLPWTTAALRTPP